MIGNTEETCGSAAICSSAASSICLAAPGLGSSLSSAAAEGAAASTLIPESGPPSLTWSRTRCFAESLAMSNDESSAAPSATASTVSTARPPRRPTLRRARTIASRQVTVARCDR